MSQNRNNITTEVDGIAAIQQGNNPDDKFHEMEIPCVNPLPDDDIFDGAGDWYPNPVLGYRLLDRTIAALKETDTSYYPWPPVGLSVQQVLNMFN